ncbi:MAG TPA: hypothetical protein DCX60_02840 [Phycisphaerales bacterium]|nr:hypothetical protein [Phycisphaerales bacterium]
MVAFYSLLGHRVTSSRGMTYSRPPEGDETVRTDRPCIASAAQLLYSVTSSEKSSATRSGRTDGRFEG